MATVIGIFENQYLKNKPLTVLDQAIKHGGLPIFMIQFKYALRL